MSLQFYCIQSSIIFIRIMIARTSSTAAVGLVWFVGSIGVRTAMASLRAANAKPLMSIRSFTSSHSVNSVANDVNSSPKAKKSPIYTRTGDQGTSSLYNGERRSKNDMIFHALGHQDELNAVLGIAREYSLVANNGLEEKISEIQSRLFDLGAAVATPVTNSSEEKLNYTKFPSSYTGKLESWIDELDSQLPPLTNFVLPSGGMSATHLNLARTICRRAERAVVVLVQEGIADKETGRYLNRLSDFLFVAARTAAKREGRTESIWKKG